MADVLASMGSNADFHNGIPCVEAHVCLPTPVFGDPGPMRPRLHIWGFLNVDGYPPAGSDVALSACDRSHSSCQRPGDLRLAGNRGEATLTNVPRCCSSDVCTIHDHQMAKAFFDCHADRCGRHGADCNAGSDGVFQPIVGEQ